MYAQLHDCLRSNENYKYILKEMLSGTSHWPHARKSDSLLVWDTDTSPNIQSTERAQVNRVPAPVDILVAAKRKWGNCISVLGSTAYRYLTLFHYLVCGNVNVSLILSNKKCYMYNNK